MVTKTSYKILECLAKSPCGLESIKENLKMDEDLLEGSFKVLEISGYIKKIEVNYDLTIYGWANFLQRPGDSVDFYRPLSVFTLDDFKPPCTNLTREQRAHEVLGAYLLFPKIFI